MARCSTRPGERRADVAIEDGRVVEVGDVAGRRSTILDAHGCIVAPGFVDLHVHLREPGREEAETIETGSRAAALGGFTAIVAMPNTEPAQDSLAVDRVRPRPGASAPGCATSIPAGASPSDREGTALAPFGELAAAGVRLFTDDGNGVQDPQLMRHALEYAGALDITLAQHCEVASLTKGAVMHEGSCCSHLGLPGWPSIAEELMVHRDIELSPAHRRAASTCCTCRPRGSVELVRAAKADGLPVTAEAAPHHFTLTDELLAGYDAGLQGQPAAAHRRPTSPRSRPGSPTARSTRSPPITPRIRPKSRRRRSTRRRPGMLGLETALALAISELDMPLADIVAALSWKPAAIAGIADRHGRPIAAGEPANLVVFDPAAEWTVVPAKLASKSRNTPYAGRTVRGKVRHTLLAGTPVDRSTAKH